MRRSSLAPIALMALAAALAACASPAPALTPLSTIAAPDLDAATQTLISNSERVVFVIPFSHWDTDWHDTFDNYVKLSDANILAAIQMAKASSRFRYTLEQVLFVKHFWDNYPADRADLKAAVQRRQISFAWAGITQPETSLVAPAIQVRNLQLGEDWITENFGSEYVPHTAWQSDAFGNSASFPQFLTQFGITNLFIGRLARRCAPNDPSCLQLPEAFYWQTPYAPTARVLVTYVTYPSAWDAIHRIADESAQVTALRQIVDAQFQRASNSKFIFLPMGSDFQDPLPNLPSLVDRWNAVDKKTLLVMASPETAFRYVATQKLPEFNVDMNPIWQAFYVTRPYAKIADKESEFYLTAGDKFGTLIEAPQSSAWYTATMNAHYDNIGAVSFDSVWTSTQQPRFQQTVETAANDLASTLAHIASGLRAPLVLFNPTSWSRSEIVELHGNLPDVSSLPAPVQLIGTDAVAFRAESMPGIGYAAPTQNNTPLRNPASAVQSDNLVRLSNGLVSVTLDGAHGGAISSLHILNYEFVSGYGDDITYIDDSGDVYGSFFGQERARESAVPAQIAVLANGPLIARAQAVLSLGGKPITKTVTLRADDPLIDVNLQIAAISETTAIAQTSTTISATTRTDDLGFGAFVHPIDNRPIVAGDVTYRRAIFYPIMSWGDTSANGAGLTMITHGLQGLGGTGTLNLMLVRQVTERNEGVTDSAYHTLHYAYLPHAEQIPNLPNRAYEFNQPLIPVWRAGDFLNVQLPFADRTRQFRIDSNAPARPDSFTLVTAQNAIIADLRSQNGQTEALTIDYDPETSPILRIGDGQVTVPANPLTWTPVVIK